MAGNGRRSNKTSHRKSFISNTSPTLPRCHSPMSSKLFKNIFLKTVYYNTFYFDNF